MPLDWLNNCNKVHSALQPFAYWQHEESMAHHRMLSALMLGVVLAVSVTGCSRDPNVKKQKYLASGKKYFEEGKYREAGIQFSNALQVDPKFAEAHYELARTYIHMDPPAIQSAYMELRRAVDLKPDLTKAQLDLGGMLLGARQFDAAMERANLVLQKEPKNADAQILKASAEAGKGNMDQALADLKTAIEWQPNESKPYLAMALAQVGVKNMEEAEANFKKAIALDPKSMNAIMALGSFYEGMKRLPDAEQQFKAAVALEPKNPTARAVLARIYILQGDLPQAEAVLTQAKKDLSDNPKGYRLLLDYYLGRNQADKAIAEVQSLLQEHPKDLKLKKSYIGMLMLQNKSDEAARLNDEILKDNAKDTDALVVKGQLLVQQKKPKDAIEILQKVIKTQADNAMAHQQLGNAFAALGDMGRAEPEYREAARLDSHMLEAQEALAAVALRKHDIDLLMTTSEKIIQMRPRSSAGYILRSAAYFSRKENAKGEADLKKAMELNPNNPVSYTRLAEYRLSQKRYAEAEKLFEQSMEKNPEFVEGMNGLITLYGLQKNLPKALARVNAQIAKAPNSSAFYLMLGTLQLSNRQPDLAEASLQRSIDLNKSNIDATTLLAQVQLARGKSEQAIATYQAAVQSNPRDVRSMVSMGAVYELKGDTVKAEQLYRKALEIEPDSPLASNNLAYLLLQEDKDIDSAASLAQVAREKMPDSPGAADTLAFAYYKKGAYGLAIDLLEEAVKKVPQNPTYHYHLGLAYEKTHDRAKTQMHFEKVLQLDPKYGKAPEIKHTLELLSRG